MNCFQIIKSVLDEAYNDIKGSEEEKDALILGALESLRNDYSNLLTSTGIDYSHPITRFAYVYKYVTSHANLVYTIIKNSDDLSAVFDNEEVKVACIGGGPGSDFLGILKYLMNNGKKPKVKFQIYDKEKTWAESWSDVEDKVDPGFRISTYYSSLDVTKPEDWQHCTKYLQSNLFTMIYFMSEVRALQDSSNDYFANLFKNAKQGALFLFVDNNDPAFYGWFDELAEKHGVEILKSIKISMTAPWDESKHDLGKYYEKFKHPKLTARVAYRIGCKS